MQPSVWVVSQNLNAGVAALQKGKIGCLRRNANALCHSEIAFQIDSATALRLP